MSRNAHGHFETWQLFLLDMQKLTLALQQIKVYHVHETTLIVLFGPTLAAMCKQCAIPVTNSKSRQSNALFLIVGNWR